MPNMSDLTPAERDVLAMVEEGLTNSQIADRRGVSANTVSNQISRILLRLGLDNRLQAARWFRDQVAA